MGKLFLAFLFLFLPHAAFFSATAAGRCVRQCGSTLTPYPFGFSGDCPILLACNATASTAALLLPHNSTAAAPPYPIISFNSTASTFVVSVDPSCNRTFAEAVAALASAGAGAAAGYGASYRTALFLSGDNCGRGAPPGSAVTFSCSISSQFMALHAQCSGGGSGGASSSSCVASTTNLNASTAAGPFMDWNKVRAAGCEDALTAAVYYGDTLAGTPSLQFGVAEMGWWLNGTCAGAGAGGVCAANATCQDVETPGGARGHRCACRDGMSGDGFAAGEGCHHYDADRSKKILLIVAGVVAGAVAAGGAVLLCLAQCRRCRARRWSSERLAAMRLLSEAATSSGVPVYSYAEVARATNSFCHTHRLGTGAYGTVYVGKLPGSSCSAPAAQVAIKRLHCRHHHEDDDAAAAAQLLNEIKLISSVSHPNLVRLLGCCLDRGEQILVYEYVPNGTLSHHLAAGALPWRARLGVAAETAAAIAHLHGMRPPIFHRDVKSSNILLDASLRPKLADFGLSRAGAGDRLGGATRSHVSTAPQGTPGYVDPEYHQCFHLSDKSDVYSFGVVLLELITAMKVVDFDRPAAEVNLASLALDRIGKGRVAEIVDPAVLAGAAEEEWVMESVRHVSELAFRCLAFHKDVRPAMSEVAAELCRIRDAAAPDSGSDDHPGSSRLIRPMMMDVHVDVSLDGPDAAGKKAVSPVSVQEVWVSDRSSPSTNGSLPRFVA
ncbi:unnamed protein product [Urochloa decumbens]|uniref:Protein kinase domain-containing protein n=1 Tax=Urochloa decumbens TaxID=240449 RepID=A0ABC9GCE8_9POAL